jgi:hypothetical protein
MLQVTATSIKKFSKVYFRVCLVDQSVRLEDENDSSQKSDCAKRSEDIATILEEEVTQNHHDDWRAK